MILYSLVEIIACKRVFVYIGFFFIIIIILITIIIVPCCVRSATFCFCARVHTYTHNWTKVPCTNSFLLFTYCIIIIIIIAVGSGNRTTETRKNVFSKLIKKLKDSCTNSQIGFCLPAFNNTLLKDSAPLFNLEKWTNDFYSNIREQ